MHSQLDRPGRLDAFGTSIFAEMSALAVSTGSINLGQGFPDTDGPTSVLQAAAEAILQGRGNQYPPGIGIPELRHAVAAHQHDWYGVQLDPDSQVLITVGATEAIASAVLALGQPGDEVLTFEPYYDSYGACIELAGARRRVVTLRPTATPRRSETPRPTATRWTFDPDELRAAINPSTRLILLNSPHNPTGTVFTRNELNLIAALAIEHDLIVITDEVYEHLVFDGTHVPLATLPGMFERTVTISSAGKTFGVTGWKVGWATGPAKLINRLRSVKQFLTYVGSGPFQYAIAEALSQSPPSFYLDAAQTLQSRRDQLVTGLGDMGFLVHSPQGSYFASIDLGSDAQAWCRALPAKVGVVAIPSRVFYDSDIDRYARLAFCKKPEVLTEGLESTESSRAVRVAAVQHDICWEDAVATCARLEPLIAQAAAAKARLVVLSEMFATGFSMRPEVVAQPQGGSCEQFLIEQARRHQLWVVGSIAQRPDAAAKAVNVAVLAGPDGELHRYQKIHPFTYGGEHEHYRAGKDFLTVTIDDVRVSVFVCYDLRFADEFWQRAQDTDLYVIPANWPQKRREHWQILLRARAIENLAYVVGCNRVGSGDNIDYCGDSAIIDPRGRVLAEASVAETILVADIDPAEVARNRNRFGFLVDRR